MKQDLIILEKDKQWARERVAHLEKEIQDLGSRFYEVFNQSSETWHDNAPFDALRDHQSMLDAERQQLKRVLERSFTSVPKLKANTIGIGTTVKLTNDVSEITYLIAGDWTPRAGQKDEHALVVSAKAPVAEQLIGKKKGEQVSIAKKTYTITEIV